MWLIATVHAQVFTHPVLGELHRVPAGSYAMGSATGDPDERPERVIQLSPYWIMGVEVTQGMWRTVMGANPSMFAGCDDCPVENVSWQDATTFGEHLSTDGIHFRLPTEAEWEVAARGGQHPEYPGSDDPAALGWYDQNAGGRTHPVASKRANAYGLYDFGGNVWEWVADWYGPYNAHAVTNPTGPESGAQRVVRGGGWGHPAATTRVTGRASAPADAGDAHVGFRLVTTDLDGPACERAARERAAHQVRGALEAEVRRVREETSAAWAELSLRCPVARRSCVDELHAFIARDTRATAGGVTVEDTVGGFTCSATAPGRSVEVPTPERAAAEQRLLEEAAVRPVPMPVARGPNPRKAPVAPRWPELTPVPTGEGRNDVALVVAIEDYLYDGVPPIPGAERSAEAWLDWFAEGRQIPASRIFEAVGQEARREQILDLAAEAAAAAQEPGTLWFVFVGHGAPNAEHEDPLLLGVDTPRSAAGIHSRGVLLSELLLALERGRQGSTVVLVDASFSGKTGPNTYLVPPPNRFRPTYPWARVSDRTRLITATSDEGGYAGQLVGVGGGRPAFSYLALGGLMGWADVAASGNRDGWVSAKELTAYIQEAVALGAQGSEPARPRLEGADARLGTAVAFPPPPVAKIVGATLNSPEP